VFSLLQDIVDRELTDFETAMVLSTPTNSRNTAARPRIVVTIDVVNILVGGGATSSNYLKFLQSFSSLVIGYYIRAYDSNTNIGDVNRTEGFYDIDGELIGEFKVASNHDPEPGLKTPIVDPVDFIGGRSPALSDVLRDWPLSWRRSN
jgi:hypothetical protein